MLLLPFSLACKKNYGIENMIVMAKLLTISTIDTHTPTHIFRTLNSEDIYCYESSEKKLHSSIALGQIHQIWCSSEVNFSTFSLCALDLIKIYIYIRAKNWTLSNTVTFSRAWCFSVYSVHTHFTLHSFALRVVTCCIVYVPMGSTLTAPSENDREREKTNFRLFSHSGRHQSR